ncbi:MAG TPA: hypothetical protein DCZ13_16050 [Porticoccaceae bacterium]|nr:hypothetical protein [Porticoccaceae bacterium]
MRDRKSLLAIDNVSRTTTNTPPAIVIDAVETDFLTPVSNLPSLFFPSFRPLVRRVYHFIDPTGVMVRVAQVYQILLSIHLFFNTQLKKV